MVTSSGRGLCSTKLTPTATSGASTGQNTRCVSYHVSLGLNPSSPLKTKSHTVVDGAGDFKNIPNYSLQDGMEDEVYLFPIN